MRSIPFILAAFVVSGPADDNRPRVAGSGRDPRHSPSMPINQEAFSRV
jgi:hypothetical protein